MSRLVDKVALVTGGSRGIGRSIALTLAREGAKVAVNYSQSKTHAEKVVEEIEKLRGIGTAIKADVGDADQATELVSATEKQLGPVDILVNNAGLSIPGDLLTMSESDLQEMYKVNVLGMIHCTRLVAKHMVERRYGKIVNIGSIAGVGTNFTGTTPYASTKASTLILTKRFALELGPYGINVNSIAPGFIETEMNTRGKSKEAWASKVEEMSGKSMLRRIGQPQDIANAALFLSSDEASFITGQVIVVDGGRLDYLSHSL